MSALHKREINGKEYQFSCETYSTYNSWGHRCILFCNGVEVTQQKIRYYNRTWESYQYQSVMRKCADILIGRAKEFAVDWWKRQNEKKRISSKMKQYLIENDVEVKHYQALYDSI